MRELHRAAGKAAVRHRRIGFDRRRRDAEGEAALVRLEVWLHVERHAPPLTEHALGGPLAHVEAEAGAVAARL